MYENDLLFVLKRSQNLTTLCNRNNRTVYYHSTQSSVLAVLLSLFLYYSVLLENESPAKCRVKLAKMLGITEHFWVTRFPVSIEKAEQYYTIFTITITVFLLNV